MTADPILFNIYRFVGIPVRLLLAFLIAFSSFPFNMQRVSAAPAGSALEFNGLSQYVTFGSAQGWIVNSRSW